MNTPLNAPSASVSTLAPVFRTREDFFAYQSAWKAAHALRTPLPSGAYAAHALLTGRPLARAFSPSRRGGQPPLGGVATALDQVFGFAARGGSLVLNHAWFSLLLSEAEPRLSAKEAAALRTAWAALSARLHACFSAQGWPSAVYAMARGEHPLPASTKALATTVSPQAGQAACVTGAEQPIKLGAPR